MSDQMVSTMMYALAYLTLAVLAIVIMLGGFMLVLLIVSAIKEVAKEFFTSGEYEE